MKQYKLEIFIIGVLIFLLWFFWYDKVSDNNVSISDKIEIIKESISYKNLQDKEINTKIIWNDILEWSTIIWFWEVNKLFFFNDLSYNEKESIKGANSLWCIFKEDISWAVISPECFLSDFSEYYSGSIENFTGSIEWIWDDIDDFSNTYELYASEFEYKDSKPIFKEQKLNDFYDFLLRIRKEGSDKSVIWKLISENNLIYLSQKEFFILKIFDYNYFVAKRDKLDQLWGCSKNNYDVALIAIDKKLLKPWDVFDVNKRLAYRIWYCAETMEDYDNYVFQSWVCWASTQVFRIWLIHPELEVLERHPHRTRYERYYDTTIWWDDATIIEFRKSMKLQNVSQNNIYFKYIDKWDYALLAWISSKKSDKKVKVYKKQTWELSAEVKKEVYDEEGNLLSQKEWKSNYVNVSKMRVN